MQRLFSLFSSPQPIPAVYRSNFRHYYLDVAWWGVLSGSSLAFTSIYAARLGAVGWQIAMLTALPAIVNLMITLPAGKWLVGKPMDRVVFWTAMLGRLLYAAFIFLPWLFFNDTQQIQAILLLTFVMTIPAPALTVAFNTLFAETVPPEWRSHVVGIRNALLALGTTLVTLLCGWILARTPFPTGYQIVFGIGFFGAIMSTYHLFFVRSYRQMDLPGGLASHNLEAGPGQIDLEIPVPTRLAGLRRIFQSKIIRFDILQGHYGRVILLLFSFHLAQYLAIPVFPLFQVNDLHFSDDVIGLGSALFNFTVFLGSTQLYRISSRLNFKQVTGWGVVALGIYPALMTVSQTIPVYAITSLIGGVAWALAGGALYNYLVEKVPANDRPAHMAWYNLALNAAILIGSLFGAEFANQIGLAPALLIFAAVRVLSGFAILRWG